MVWIGIDNGSTGSIGIIWETPDGVKWVSERTPVKRVKDYQKRVKGYSVVSRVDVEGLKKLLKSYVLGHKVRVLLERPMVTPRRFKASVSAIRAFEATLIALEQLGIPYEEIEVIDARTWRLALKLEPGDLEKIFIGLKGEDHEGLAIALYSYRRETTTRGIQASSGSHSKSNRRSANAKGASKQ